MISRASVEDTDYEYFAQDDFRVRKPDIKFVFTGKPTHSVAHDMHVRLENPLPIPLTKAIFQIEGSGIDTPMIIKVSDGAAVESFRLNAFSQQVSDVSPQSFAETRFAYKPPYVGSAKLVAQFTSKEMDDVDGFKGLRSRPSQNTC